ILGTVEGDIHDIGKNLVGMLLEGGGFEVIDLGIDVPAERFVKEVKVEKPQVLGLSALLTTTMPAMKDVIETLTEAGVREDVKVIVGGAPVTENFAKTIGADGYAPDAAGAVVKVRELIQI
ncbi:MAG: cobalamin-dependent protein, partial [Deltaproteobacteria bacterium]|nr:cobalamin-dependent protein [Deltaproteobacteria bacterium]